MNCRASIPRGRSRVCASAAEVERGRRGLVSDRGRKFLVLTFSVVANGGSLASVKKRGRISFNFASLQPLQPCVGSEERKDAMAQGRKDWKPQNPSESGKFSKKTVYFFV